MAHPAPVAGCVQECCRRTGSTMAQTDPGRLRRPPRHGSLCHRPVSGLTSGHKAAVSPSHVIDAVACRHSLTRLPLRGQRRPCARMRIRHAPNFPLTRGEGSPWAPVARRVRLPSGPGTVNNDDKGCNSSNRKSGCYDWHSPESVFSRVIWRLYDHPTQHSLSTHL